jgi:hypothetical protein
MKSMNDHMQQNVHPLTIVHTQLHPHGVIKIVPLVHVNILFKLSFSQSDFHLLQIFVNIQMIIKISKTIGKMLKMFVKLLRSLFFFLINEHTHLDAELYS